MMMLEQKYTALLAEGARCDLPAMEGVRLCFHILSLATHINRDCAHKLAAHSLTEGRFIVLFLLNAVAEPLAPHVLAERAGVSRATITGLIDGLEQQRYVERCPHPTDRRGCLISLTAEGKNKAKVLFKEHAVWIASLLQDFSDKEKEILEILLSKIASRLPISSPA